MSADDASAPPAPQPEGEDTGANFPSMTSIDERAHRNLCDFSRFCARLETRAELVDRDGVVAAVGVDNFPSARQAVRANTSLSADAWAAAVDEIFTAGGR